MLLLARIQEKAPPPPPIPDPLANSIEKVFDPNDPKAGYQRKYTINVGAKSEDCFVIEEVIMGQIMNFHWMVRNLIAPRIM